MSLLLLTFLAGALSTLSPCVLPLLPLVLSAAHARHAFGPLALSLGLALSFAAIGLFVATLGFALGLDADLFRTLSALIMLILALVMIAPAAPDGLKLQFGGFTHWIHARFANLSWDGWQGQLITGLLLGALWSPCVGPILGAASLLASQRQDLGFVAASMLLFGLGASLPLLALGMMSQSAGEKLKARLRLSGQSARVIFASLLVLISLLTLSGWDKKLETILVDLSPEWLTQLTTRF
jgi:cytochrome c biogenesis protein CcdA